MAMNVLIVDDSSVMRSMILKTLRMSGVSLGEVHNAGNGREGLDILDSNWIDLVFLDINMPVMTGEEMIDEMRRNDLMKDTPVIVVSTEGSQTRIDQLMKHKAVKFIHKPFTPEVIRDAVLEVTGASGSED
ncbi:MAG: response regulator [Desulfobacterales bacterium]|nr:response regulator [Desulfobacterales bacterium]